MGRYVLSLLVVVLFVGESAGEVGRAPFGERAGAVVRRWHESGAAEVWTHGFVPEGDLTVASPEVQRQLEADVAVWELLAADPGNPGMGEVRWGDGSSARVPLLSAREVVNGFTNIVPRDPCDPPDCTRFEVTEAKLASAKVQTNRGEAIAPAWRLRVKGVTGTFDQVAVDLEGSGSLEAALGEVESAVGGYESTGSQLTVQFSYGSCDRVRGLLVYEERDVVVVGVDLAYPEGDGICAGVGLSEKRTVELKAPLQKRVVLEVDSGRPVRRGFPSWGTG